MRTDRIEQIVCASVNEVIRLHLSSYEIAVDTDLLYKGTTKVPLCVSMARQFCYYVMHDMYHMPYSFISLHSKNSTRGVISGVNKVRALVFVDTLYHDVLERIKEKL